MYLILLLLKVTLDLSQLGWFKSPLMQVATKKRILVSFYKSTHPHQISGDHRHLRIFNLRYSIIAISSLNEQQSQISKM